VSVASRGGGGLHSQVVDADEKEEEEVPGGGVNRVEWLLFIFMWAKTEQCEQGKVHGTKVEHLKSE
jgi:hypothetical protein